MLQRKNSCFLYKLVFLHISKMIKNIAGVVHGKWPISAYINIIEIAFNTSREGKINKAT